MNKPDRATARPASLGTGVFITLKGPGGYVTDVALDRAAAVVLRDEIDEALEVDEARHAA